MTGSESPLTDALALEDALRRRLAADLHDDPLQALAAVAMGLELARMQDEIDFGTLREIESAARDATRRLRRMLAELTGPEPSEPLQEALEAHCSALGQACEVRVVSEPPDPMRRVARLIASDAAAAGATGIRVSHDAEGTRVEISGSEPDPELATARARLAGGECRRTVGGYAVTLPAI